MIGLSLLGGKPPDLKTMAQKNKQTQDRSGLWSTNLREEFLIKAAKNPAKKSDPLRKQGWAGSVTVCCEHMRAGYLLITGHLSGVL